MEEFSVSKVVGVVFLVVALGMVIGWAAQGYEQARRETFEQTKSYNQWVIQEVCAENNLRHPIFLPK